MVFGFGKPHFLGIDFGTSSIKAVELSIEDNRPVLINYGRVILEDVKRRKELEAGGSHDDEIVLYLRELLKSMKPKSDSAYVSMPAFTGLISLVEFPLMEESELQDAARFEAHKYIPSSLDEIALSWEVVNVHDTPGDGQKMEVLLVAALNKEVARYEKLVTDGGLALNFLELETFSLARSLVGDERGLFLIIDIGSRATNLILIDDGAVRVSRNMDDGGTDITRVLAESLGITRERAKLLKKSGKDFLSSPESALSFPSLQAIAGEAGRMLASYQVRHPGVQCKSVLLSGGVAQFTGLTAYYSNILKVPVTIGDPWKNVQHDPMLTPTIGELGTSFSVAVGLALCGTDMTLKKKQALTKKTKKDFSLKEFLTKPL
ncbi:MAG: type IV pilus assembly protein PilM [Candidatus Moraniibacteriota bacterium]